MDCFCPEWVRHPRLLGNTRPFLLRRQDISSLGPAAAEIDVSSEDLIDVSQLALGPVLHVVLRGDVEVVPRSGESAKYGK